ncbi:putative pentatricopeptide repeat-containing protein At3g08820 [Oryza brachyantha]|nr:putative pentatricopeptide repeat-containing protein At3g08820 [Oryza brachyantha]
MSADAIGRLLLAGANSGNRLPPLTVKLLHARLLRLDLLAGLSPLLLRALSSSSLHLHALRLHTHLPPPSHRLTFPLALNAASRLPGPLHLHAGEQLHARSLKLPSHATPHVLTSLLSLYARCGLPRRARRVFDEMARPTTVSWTALITAYMDAGDLDEAVRVARSALASGMRPDSFTAVRVLTACARVADLVTGETAWRAAEQAGFAQNVFVATAAVDLYIKCGEIAKARDVFDKMQEKDAVAWSTMVGGYASNGHPREALDLFLAMQAQGVRPDCYTIAGALSACTRLGALHLGRQTIKMVDWNEFLDNPVLGTALIDIYAKCGSTAEAWALFQQMRKKDIIVWNAMILGLGMTGHEKIAFALVGQMEKSGVKLNDSTFIGLLCSCTHTGLVQDGRRYFHNMTRLYHISPRIEHYGCMVDLLSRTGLLQEARQLIDDMPMQANAVVWGALLGGCKIHRNTELAEYVLKQLIQLEPWNSGNYVMLSNIYSNRGRWEDAAKIRLDMKVKGVEKIPAYSWVEFDGKVHEFRAGDKSHPLSDQIYKKLDELGLEMKTMGYEPTTEVVMFDVEDEEKEHTLLHHSEKLAIAFKLLVTGPGETIRVTKNLRVCSDCHTAIKLISRITHREIIVRDNNRFHCFRDGSCSCNDYW